MPNAVIFIPSTLIDDALTMSGLSPVARIASPRCVLKNMTSNTTVIKTAMRATKILITVFI